MPRGGVAGIAQSGSVSDAFVHSGDRIGFSRIISCGSEVVLDVCDYLAYCLDDPETSSVILFLEGFKRPERFLALADRALELGKPIMAVKVGHSDQAQAAAVAHTGSLAGEARVTDAALEAAGVIRCRDLDELLETAELVEGVRRTGRRVGRGRAGVVTVSTGEASLIADLVPATGLALPAIPGSARAAILEALPTMGYIGNPLDPWGAADATTAYGAAFEAMAASRAYDVLVIVHDFPYRSLRSEVNTANEVTAALLAATADRPEILPVYVSLTSGEPPPETKALLDTVGGGAPLLRGAVAAFRAIAEVAAWEGRHSRRVDDGPWRDGWPALATDRTSYGGETTATPPARRGRSPVALSEPESLAFIGRTGIAVSSVVAVPDAAAAVREARSIAGPVALKLDAVGLAHKSDVGGVALGLRGDDAVYGAALTLLEIGRRRGLTVRGLLISAMAPHGVELILGYRRDPQFGPTVLVGFGGILTEVLDDVAVRLAPLDHAAADAMLDDLRGSPILGALRGRPAVDRGTVAEMLVTLGRLGVERPDVLEVDLNPVIASAGGAIAVDALVVLEAGDSSIDPTEPVLLTERTSWGVRLTLKSARQAQCRRAELVEPLSAAIETPPPTRPSA